MLLNPGALSLFLGLREQIVLGRDTVEPRLLSLIVDGANAIGAFEHDMLEVVGDTSIGTILGASLYHNGSKHLGLRVVLIQPNSHAVTQFQLFHLQLCMDISTCQNGQNKECNTFHIDSIS